MYYICLHILTHPRGVGNCPVEDIFCGPRVSLLSHQYSLETISHARVQSAITTPHCQTPMCKYILLYIIRYISHPPEMRGWGCAAKSVFGLCFVRAMPCLAPQTVLSWLSIQVQLAKPQLATPHSPAGRISTKIMKFSGFLSFCNWGAGDPSRVPWSLIRVRGVRREAGEA